MWYIHIIIESWITNTGLQVLDREIGPFYDEEEAKEAKEAFSKNYNKDDNLVCHSVLFKRSENTNIPYTKGIK